MLKPGSMIRTVREGERAKTLPSEFGLLCWNVQKQNLRVRFHLYFKEMLHRYPIDLVALQEVKINPAHTAVFEDFHFSMAPNIRFFDHVYGVLNGSRIPETETFSLLSTHRESMIQTHKSAIFSHYPLPDGGTLLLVNLHAINFRATRVYHREIETIFEKIRHHQGALIVAGDFNSWNTQRMNVLMKLSGELHLHAIEMDHPHLVKSFMTCRLDHIFYRGLRLRESHVVDVERFSDHNALYARFETL